MKKIILAVIFVSLCAGAYSQVVITPPAGANTTQTNAIALAAKALEAQLNANVYDQLRKMPLLTRGFNNANVAASNAASNQSFQNYDIFSVQVGGAIGMAIKKSVGDDLENTGDTYAGIAGQGAINVGINTSPFLMKNLYLNVKYGSYNVGDHDDAWKGSLFGVGANYSIYEDYSILSGLFRWRGISLGTGVTISSTKLSTHIDYDSQTVTGTYAGVPLTLTASDPEAKLYIKTTSFIIPVEAVSSIQLLWLANLGLGAGVDFAFSSTKIGMDGESAIYASGAGITSSTPGKVNVHYSSTSKAKFTDIVAPKLLGSVGLNLGPVKIDMPVSYYFCNVHTFSVGLNAGFVW
jgi:hypothetical protein